MTTFLIFGAGVLGSLYAAKLHEAGYDVTILARGARLTALQRNGVVLEKASTGEHTVTQVPVVGDLRPDDHYDAILVLVRKDQMPGVLPLLSANHATPAILFMANNAAGPDAYGAAIGHARVLLGFPGAGGERVGDVVRYNIVSRAIQPTCLGALDGASTPRVRAIAAALRAAGFPTVIRPQMDAWQKTHVALVSPMANAIYLANGSNYALAQQRESVQVMVRAIREGFGVLRALKIPLTPALLGRVLSIAPEPLLVAIFQRVLATQWAEITVARHANVARDEMLVLAQEFRTLAEQADFATPAMDALDLGARKLHPR